MKKVVCLFIYVAIIATSCKINSDILIENPTEIEFALKYKIYKNINKEPIEEGYISRISAKSNDTFSKKIRNGYVLKIIAEIPPDGFSIDEQMYTIAGVKGVYKRNHIISIPNIRKFDPDNSILQVKNSFYELNEINFGFRKIDIRNAIETYFGALILVVPPKKEGERGHAQILIQPSGFSSRQTMDEIRYVNSNDEKTIDVSKDLLFSFSQNYPIVGTLFGAAQSSDYSQLFWQMKGFGWIIKKENSNWNVFDAYEKLSPESKIGIQEKLDDNPNSFLMYINEMYAIRDLSYNSVYGKKVNIESDISAASMWTVNGIYNFSSETSERSNFSEFVYDFGGIPIIPPKNQTERKFNHFDIKSLLDELNIDRLSIEFDDESPVLMNSTNQNLKTITEWETLLKNYKDKYIETTIAPIDELIKGQVGKYYYVQLYSNKLIDLNSGTIAREKLLFRSGEFCANIINDQFIDTYKRFYGIYDSIIKTGAITKVYIIGSADMPEYNIKPSKDKCNAYNVDMIEFLPRFEYNQNQFINDVQFLQVPDFIDNNDLPYLRAYGIKMGLQKAGIFSEILQGGVSGRTSENDRNVSIILYIEGK